MRQVNTQKSLKIKSPARSHSSWCTSPLLESCFPVRQFSQSSLTAQTNHSLLKFLRNISSMLFFSRVVWSCCQPHCSGLSLAADSPPALQTFLLLKEQSRRGQSDRGIWNALSLLAAPRHPAGEALPCSLLACVTAMAT